MTRTNENSQGLVAVLSSAIGDDLPLRLRIVNTSDTSIDVLNPDLGRPSPQMRWPFSVETYRASLLMSFAYLKVSVVGESGEAVEKEPVETFATPALRAPVTLASGDAVEFVIPLRPFFSLSPGRGYRVSVEYGSDVKVRADCRVAVP